jgi:hypothetical protein
MTPLLDRFNEKWMPEPNSGCWLWLGATNADGYGRINTGGFIENAHRASWMLYRSAVPLGLHVLHRCDVPGCVNPQHLFLGDNDANVADKTAKGRAAKKLSQEDVAAIKSMVAAGFSQRATAKAFAISQHGVSFIVRGKRHQHIKGDTYVGT